MRPESIGRVMSVLIIDDDERILRSVVRLLRGRSVFTAATFQQRRDLAVRYKPDLAIVDHLLGPAERPGVELIRELRACLPTMRSALYSAQMDIELAIEAKEAGADHAFPKGVDYRFIIAQFEGMRDEVAPPGIGTLERVTWEHISRAVKAHGGNIAQSAKCLGVSRETLRRRLRAPPGK